MKTILITGAAGDIGRGMSKILNDSPIINKVYGMDINEKFPSHIFYEKFFKAPRVTDAEYIQFIESLISRLNIDVIIPSSEIEIRYFNKNRISEISDVPIIMASFNIMDIGFDKLATARFLEKNKLPFPQTVISTEQNNIKLPCIMKSRFGAGSKGVSIVEEENILEYKRKASGEFIFQEYIPDEMQEYTCGVFKSRRGQVEIIIFRRELRGGRTGYGEVVNNESIISIINELVKNIDFIGSINIQLRLKDGVPYIFEINPRFSSTLVFRHMLGFKDLEWSIKESFNNFHEIEYVEESVIGKKVFVSEKEIIY